MRGVTTILRRCRWFFLAIVVVALTLPIATGNAASAGSYNNGFHRQEDLQDWLVLTGRDGWHREGDWYVASSAEPSVTINRAVGNTVGDLTVSVLVQFQSAGGGRHGFVLRRPTLGKADKDADFYFLGLDGQGNGVSTLMIVKYRNGEAVENSSSRDCAVQTDTVYRLEAVAVGNNLKVTLSDADGKSIQSLNWADAGGTPRYTHGYVGLLNSGTAARFGDFNASFTPMQIDWVREDADWLMRAVAKDGAIGHYVDKVAVRPYMAHFAALALARATEVTGDPKYAEAAWNWLDWYHKHMDVDGFVTDYDLKDGSWVSTEDMDSTDAYAAMFLVAFGEVWRVTENEGRLQVLRPAVAKALDAIEATMDKDGLTWAKPTWHVKYMMDNAEVFAGLKAGLDLAVCLNDTELVNRFRKDLNQLAAGVEGLWNGGNNTYDWARHGNGVQQECDWKYFYPDALQQVWAVAFGLATGERATHLLQTFAAAHPNWDVPTALDNYRDHGEQMAIEYWPVIGWAYARTGDFQTALTAAARIRQAALAARRAWPFHVMTAGELLLLESGGF